MATSTAVAQTLGEHPTAALSAATAAPAASLFYGARRAKQSHASGQSDPRRSWLWCFLVLLVASQLYFVRELVAAFVLFAAGFGIVAVVFAGLYLLAKAWQLAINRLAELHHPAMAMAPAECQQRKAA